MKYALSSDARARAVAKDLTKLAKEHGVKLPLTSSQKVVAKLFGYETWTDLLNDLGQSRGPEDHELNASELAARRMIQIAALTDAGFSIERVEDVLSALRPTGREEESVKQSPRVWPIQTINDHHPTRAFRASTLMLDPWYGWNGYYMSLAEVMRRWSSERPVHSLDLETIEDDDAVDNLFSSIISLRENSGHVVEASALNEADIDSVDLNENWEFVPRDPAGLTNYYFHFGNHRLASPFRGIGVDGCYVELHGDDDGIPENVTFIFTTSQPFSREDEDDGVFVSKPISMLSALRVFEVSFDPCEGESVKDAIRHTDNCYSEQYAKAWIPYLRRALQAGWLALKTYRKRELQLHSALYADELPENFSLLERAATDKAMVERMKQIAIDVEEFPVRFMGKVPPHVDIYEEELRASPYPRSDSGAGPMTIEEVQVKLADIDEAARPQNMYYTAKEAMAMCLELDQESPVTRQLNNRAMANAMNGAYFMALDEAVIFARTLLAWPTGAIQDYLPGIVKVLCEHGDANEASEAVRKLRECAPFSPMTRLASVLYAAQFEPDTLADEVECTIADFYDVATKLINAENHPWGFFRSEPYEDDDDRNDHAAMLFVGPLSERGVITALQDRLRELQPSF